MSIRKSLTNVSLSITCVIGAAAITIWQFYLFVTDTPDGKIYHLLLAIVMALLTYIMAFLVFSVFLRTTKKKIRE